MNEQFFMFFTILAVVIFLVITLYFVPINLWITAIFSGVQIELFDLVFMRIRKVPVSQIVNSMITLHKAGIPVTKDKLETHYLAGGNTSDMVYAMIVSHQKNLGIEWEELARLDLSGKDIREMMKAQYSGRHDDLLQIRKRIADQVMYHLNEANVVKIDAFIKELKDKENVDF